MRSRAFTLLELLVAMAVFSMILVLTLNVIGQAGTLSSGGMAKMEAARVARECLDLIHRDLSPALLPYNRTSTNSLQLVASPPDLSPSPYANPHSLFWQAPLSRNSENGSLSSVGYFVEHSFGTTPEKNRFQLRRLYVNESDSADDHELSNDDWYKDLVPKFAAATGASPSGDPDADRGYKGWVADGVLALWVRCLDSSGTPITTNAAGQSTGFSFNSRQAYQTGSQRYPTNGFSALPPFIEIGLVTCSPSDIGRIKTLPAIGATNQPENFYKDINDFVASVQSQNPGTKTIAAYTRIIPIFTADP